MFIIFGDSLKAERAYRGSAPLGKERLLGRSGRWAAFGAAAFLAACSSDTILESAPDAGDLPDAQTEPDAAPPADGASSDAGTNASLELSDAVIDFGDVSCGADSDPRSLTLTNRGRSAATWSARLQRGAPFVIDGASSGTLAAGAQVAVKILFESTRGARSGSAYTDALIVDDGDDATPVTQTTLRAELAGADFAFTSPTIAFGNIDVAGTPASRTVALENLGNRAATVSFDQQSSGPFSLVFGGSSSATSVSLAPGAATSGIVARFDPDSDGPANASFTLVTQGAVCTVPSENLELTGTGVSSDLRVSEPELDWSLVGCGATGSAKALSLSNVGTAAVSYTLTLAKGSSSPFTLSRTSGTLNPNGSQSVTVTPKAIPAPTNAAIDTSDNAFGDVLRIREPGGTEHTVDLLQTAKGAVFQVLPASVAFPSTVVGSSRDYAVNIVNVGSARARVQYTLTPVAGPFRGSTPFGPQPVEGQNDSLVNTITFEPTAAGTFSATLTWSHVPLQGEVLCAPMPAAIPITATATP
jgi:hypothetical protein